MPEFSEESKKQLETCHGDLRFLFNEVIKAYDCKVTEGHRSVARQLDLYKQGLTKVKFGMHNHYPSLAIDVYPYPVVLPDRRRMDPRAYTDALVRFYSFGGFVLGIAHILKINIRWGGDWDRDNVYSDQNFNDLPHFELVGK